MELDENCFNRDSLMRLVALSILESALDVVVERMLAAFYEKVARLFTFIPVFISHRG